MKIIPYDDKMDLLEHLRKEENRFIKNIKKGMDEDRIPIEQAETEINRSKNIIDVIECIMEDVNQMHQLEEQCQKKQDKEVADIYEELFLK